MESETSLTTLVEEAAFQRVAGLFEDRPGLGGLAGGRVGQRLHGRAPCRKGRQREAGGAGDRILEAGLALVCDQRAVDGRADSLADGQLVGGPFVQVGLEAVGASGRLPIATVLGGLVDEVLLEARYEVAGPVDLAPEQRG